MTLMKSDGMVIDGQPDMIEKDDDVLAINTIIWQSMFDHVINPIIEHIKKLLNNDKMT